MKEKNKYFKYVIIFGVLIIPFLYSFFYLKAYWDPYGEGNIDNLDIAIVNLDKGSKGNSLIKSIKDSKKLKIHEENKKIATKGLYNGKYYALITIPSDFTSSMESVKDENKHHAMITYSPNQKSNYLASQIINNVVLNVERNLDNKINSAIVSSLSNKMEEVPKKLDTISDGFKKLKDGTNKLQNGSKKLQDGTESLKANYEKFNEGVLQVKEGTDKLKASTGELSTLANGISQLSGGVNELKTGSDTFTAGFNSYVGGVNTTLGYTQNLASLVNAAVCPKVAAGNANEYEINMCTIAQGLSTAKAEYGNQNIIAYLNASATQLQAGNNNLNNGINTLNTRVSAFSTVNDKINALNNGIATLNSGATTLYNSSLQIQDGTTTLYNGSVELTNGISTLNSSVSFAKDELDTNITKTKNDIKKLNGLGKYSKEPVKIKNKTVNKVASYGTAFSPFFISIALWVGCLMMYIVLLYDKEERFDIMGLKNKNRLQRNAAYHGLITVSAIMLGILLQALLDFQITNIFLYYFSIILVANMFMAIIQFLIMTFNDIGKFFALIILVLQLAAAGGTFPIQTVTKGFRWLHTLLPMKYTNELLRESLVSIESNLLTKNITIVIVILIIFVGLNTTIAIIQTKKEENK